MAALLPEGKQSYNDAAGNPLVGGKLYAYDAGTPNPRTTFADAAGTVPNTFPVILDARGEAVIFWDGAYDVVLRDSADNLIWSVPGISASAVDASVLASKTTISGGAGAMGFNATLNYVAGTVGARLRERVNVCDFPFLADKLGILDSTGAIQAAVNTGLEVYAPAGTFRMSTVNVPNLGQTIGGAGEALTNFQVIAGGKGFVVQARNVRFAEFQMIPPGNVAGVQSSTVADCFTIQDAISDESYIEGIEWERVSCYNIKGCAIRIISPLRESMINDCRFHGMSNGATGDGVIHCDNPGTSNRSVNNIWFTNLSVYRFAAPVINFKVTGTDATGRTETPYADIIIDPTCLFHGQNVDENAVVAPPSVQPMPCNHIYIQGVDNLQVRGSFKSVHPNFLAVRVDSIAGFTGVAPALQCNQAVDVSNIYASYGVTNPAIGSPAGGYIRITDGIGTIVNENKLRTGYFTYDIDIRDSGSHSQTLKTQCWGNLPFLSAAPTTYNYGDWICLLEPDKLTMVATAPKFILRDAAGTAYGQITVNSAGLLQYDSDPTAVSSGSGHTLKVDNVNELVVTPGQVLVNRLVFSGSGTSDGTAGNGTLYHSTTSGTLTYKDLTGVVRRINTTP